MSRRAWMGVAGAVVALAGVFVLYDVLVESDEERLEVLVDDVAGELTPASVSAARVRWVDLSRQPLEVSALGRSLLYRDGEDEALDARIAEGLAPVYGDRLSVLMRSVVVEGDEATVRMRTMGRRAGMNQSTWSLVRHGEDWLLERVLITR